MLGLALRALLSQCWPSMLQDRPKPLYQTFIDFPQLYLQGASEFEDQVIRFKPDGSSHFLVLAWKFERGHAYPALNCKRAIYSLKASVLPGRTGSPGPLVLYPAIGARERHSAVRTPMVYPVLSFSNQGRPFEPSKVHFASCNRPASTTLAKLASWQASIRA